MSKMQEYLNVNKYKDFINFYNSKYKEKYGDLMSYQQMNNERVCDKVCDIYVKKFDKSRKVIIGFISEDNKNTKCDMDFHAAILDGNTVIDFTCRQFSKTCRVPQITTKESFIKKYNFNGVGIGKDWAQAQGNIKEV